MAAQTLPVTIEGVDIWGDARDDATPDATPIVMPPGLPIPRVREGESRKQCWERLRVEARASGMNRRKAYDYATKEVDLLFRQSPPADPAPEPIPEPPAAEVVDDPPAPDPAPAVQAQHQPQSQPAAADQAAPAGPASPPPSSAGGVQGLGDLPTGWPTLPPNASLAAEVAWVHANRIRVRQGEGVDLSRAISPAPSYAALSWLETSILYPSKFADVCVKASGDQADAAEDIRREKLALLDLQALLAEAVTSMS